MYRNVFRYEYLTFQTQIHLHKQYIFDTNIIQSEYAYLFPFSIYASLTSVIILRIAKKITYKVILDIWNFSC